MNRSKYLIKNMGILTLSNFSSKILVFFLVPLYTSVLSTEEYGSYDLAVSMVTLLFPILTLNIVDAVMRFTMEPNSNKKKIAAIGLKFLAVSTVMFGVVMFVLNLTGLWPNINGLEIYVCIYYVSYAYNQFIIQLAKGMEKVREMGIAGALSTLVTVLANIVFLLVFNLGLKGFFFANILAQVLSSIYLTYKVEILNYKNIKGSDKYLQSEMIAYSIPLIATAVGWWVNSTADKYVVAAMVGVSANGLLAVSYKIPQIINTLQGIFIQAWQISAIREYGEDDTARFYGKIFEFINLLMCISGAGLILLTRPLAHILYSKDFYMAWQFVPFLIVASILNCASGLLGPVLSAQKNSKGMMWSAIIGAGANIVLNIIFVYLIGIQGATIATCICSYIIYWVRKNSIGKAIVIDRYAAVLGTWALLCIQAVIEIYLKNYIIELIVVAVLVIVNIKSITHCLYSISNNVKSKNNR